MSISNSNSPVMAGRYSIDSLNRSFLLDEIAILALNIKLIHENEIYFNHTIGNSRDPDRLQSQNLQFMLSIKLLYGE